MKGQILKIAKAKNEQEFYSKYPTEEAFMKEHGKAFMKAQMGTFIQDKGQLKKLDQLTQLKKGGKIKKAQEGVTEYMKTAGISLDDTMGTAGAAAQGPLDAIGGLGGALNIGTDLVQGVQMLKEEKQAKGLAKQYSQLSGLTEQVAGLKPDAPKRKYVRPEDQVFDPNQMTQSYGTGTNFLQMKKGGEIQNTFAPYTIYDDLEEIPNAQFGAQAGSLGAAAGSKLFGGTGQSGAGKIGTTAGSAIGNMILPGIGGTIGGALGGFVGGAIGAKGQKETANFQKEGDLNMATAAFQQGTRNQFASFMEDGGHVNPQIINRFGNHNLKDLLRKDPIMDALRSGGHLTQDYVQPNQSAFKSYAMGGDLKTHWGGKAEVQSYNPYLPGGGESVEFKGASHDDGGIGVSFGNSPVEVEGGEPAVKMQDGGGVDNLVVFGDMKIPSYGVTEIGDPKAKGKKFKSYGKELNRLEAKQNKIFEKGVDFVNKYDPNDTFESLSYNTGEMNMEGAGMKLKNIAQKKQMASAVQKAILDTAEEQGLKPSELAMGKIKKDNKSIRNAQYGEEIPLEKKYPFEYRAHLKQKEWYEPENPYYTSTAEKTDLSKAAAQEYNYLNSFKNTKNRSSYSFDSNQGNGTSNNNSQERYTGQGYGTNQQGYVPQGQSEFERISPEVNPDKTYFGFGQYSHSQDEGQGGGEVKKAEKPKPRDIGKTGKKHISPPIKTEQPYFIPGEQGTPFSVSMGDIGPGEAVKLQDYVKQNTQSGSPEEKRRGLDRNALDLIGSYLPYLRPSNQKNLDPNQLMGEMYALSSNQLEPVNAQRYQPLLETPSRISYQDALNANQSDFNAMQRQIGADPASLAGLAGQKYGANAQVIAQQERENQDRYMGAFNRNRGVLNDATLKNLSIMDQQYQRQSQAKTNTKAIAQSALNSISDKIAKNKLENRTLGVYENMYNYRFGPQGRAWNMNAPVNFKQMVENAAPYSEEVKPIKETKKGESGKNGSIVRSMK